MTGLEIDPNEGNRVWTKFVLMEGNTISRMSSAPLSFRTSTGERPTDEWLVTDGYRGYIDNGPPEYNKYEQKIIRTPLTELTVDANNEVVQTYSVVSLNEDEQVEANLILKDEINIERERRIAKGCFIEVANVGNIAIRGTNEDMRNLTNLGQLSNMFILTNQNTTIPFRDDTNTVYDLTPTQMSYVWQKAVEYVSSLYQASWNMKEMDPLPQDYTSDSYWPNISV